MNDCAVEFHSFGAPAEVLQVSDLKKTDTLGAKQIRVKVHYSPINPADINYIQGTYGVKPELPAIPGMEASAEVLESNAAGIEVGDQVIFIDRVGAWRSELVCDASSVFVLPRELDLCPQQAAMLKVNPLTALRLLEGFIQLKPGDYVIQNAANSGVGQCLIQVAKLLGLKTINIVRREDVMQELLDLGADHVLLDNSEVTAKVQEICDDHLPKLACNAVGGDSALRLMDALADQGTHVTYGAMSLRSLKVPNKFLIFKRINLHGLWVTKFLTEGSPAEVKDAYTKLAIWVNEGKLIQAVDTVYPASEAKSAAAHAIQSKRHGKILLKF